MWNLVSKKAFLCVRGQYGVRFSRVSQPFRPESGLRRRRIDTESFDLNFAFNVKAYLSAGNAEISIFFN